MSGAIKRAFLKEVFSNVFLSAIGLFFMRESFHAGLGEPSLERRRLSFFGPLEDVAEYTADESRNLLRCEKVAVLAGSHLVTIREGKTGVRDRNGQRVS